MTWTPLNVILATLILLGFFVFCAFLVDNSVAVRREVIEAWKATVLFSVYAIIAFAVCIGVSFIIVGGIALLTGQTG